MKKRFIAAFLGAAMAVANVSVMAPVSYAGQMEGYSYEIGAEVEDKELTVPETVDGETVTSVLVFNNTNVETLYIPKTVTAIYVDGKYKAEQGLKEIVVDPENPRYTSVDGVLYSKDMRYLYYYPSKKADETFVMPDDVEFIGLDAYDRDIHAYADFIPFFKCHDLKNIVFNEGLKYITDGAFYDCGIEAAVLPASVEHIGDGAFGADASLKELVIPALKDAADDMIYDCPALETVTFLDDKLDAPDETSAFWDNATSVYSFIFRALETDDTLSIYVPDEKLEVYEEISRSWFTLDFELMPMSAKPETADINVIGDVNGDGEFGVADAVVLEKWLLADSKAVLANWQAADLCRDGVLDAFDLCCVKGELKKRMSK